MNQKELNNKILREFMCTTFKKKKKENDHKMII